MSSHSGKTSRAESDDRILNGKRIRDTTEVGTGSDVGPHFAFWRRFSFYLPQSL